jgi:NAD(P)-dependent dehydrogenase (short-subunit alcohol dehydrogenase family)
MAGRLSNKNCLITGTGGSIGRASALWFAREGARVIGCDINAERASVTEAMVHEAGGDMLSLHPLDLTSETACQRLVDFALKHGPIDVLFNNAAMAYFAWIQDMDVGTFRRTLDEEVTIVFLLCKAAWPHLISRAKSAVINVASMVAHQPNSIVPGIAHTAAKGAVWSMTRQLAMEGGPHGVRVNTISPGPVMSNQTAASFTDPARWAVIGKKVMLGRVGQPEDIAGAAVFLASDESSWITGADLRVDGGVTAW